jgi:cytochrome c
MGSPALIITVLYPKQQARQRNGTMALWGSDIQMRHLLLAAFVATGAWAGVGSASAQDAAAGQTVFKTQCATCHSVVEGKKLIGPSLFGIVGRQAGQIADFKYSQANKESGLTWDEPTLDRYLTSPKDVVPKTIMAYAGVKDAQKRKDLISYLATVH